MSSHEAGNPAAAAAAMGTCPACGAELFAADRFCGGCGAPVPQAAEAELLADLQQVTLGEYEIIGVLGRGGMGLVYLAHDMSLKKKVAIKVLPPSLLQGDAAVERFRREARIAASLRHRLITSVFALKETTKLLFFVMEYVEGRTLDAILHDEGRLSIEAAQAVLGDAMAALAYAHRREVIHRDLKPANIIVDVEGMAMVTDFGVAKVSTVQGLTTTGSTVGSPKYMSPEQWSGKATGLSDQYALGCVAYELLAGRTPFEGETLEELMKQQLFDTPRPAGELRPDCPPALVDGVMRMLAKDPGQRWPSLEAAMTGMGLRTSAPDDPVRLQLAELAKRGHDVRALPKTPRSPIPVSNISLRRESAGPRRARGQRVVLWAAAALVVVGAALIGYVLLQPRATGERVKPAVAAIEVTGAPTELGAGERVTLVARATDVGGHPVAGAALAWSSSDPSVAVVTQDGTLTAVGNGTTTLTASSGGQRATFIVTVRPVTTAAATLEVTPRAARVAPGETVRLTIGARDGQGRPLGVRRVSWTSSAPSIVTVSPAGAATGLAAGTAVVTASSDGRAATAMITVLGGEAASLEVRPASVRVAVGESSQLAAVARDANGRAMGRRRVRWASNDPAVGVVSTSGVVTGLAPGTVTITATGDGAVSARSTVAVTASGSTGTAVLQVLVQPWANMTIDGASRGPSTRVVETLTAGVLHRLRFERATYGTVDTTLTLRSGEQRLLQIQMKPRLP